MKKHDLTGRVFGRLTVIKELPRVRKQAPLWLCACECGKEKAVMPNGLIAGTKSCGCLSSEITAKRNFKHGMNKRGNATPEYIVWSNMVARCYDPTNNRYNTYGARGITIFEEWRNDFKKFYDYIGPRPSKYHSIDRQNNDKGYEPGNVRWATKEDQHRNKTTNNFLIYNGERKILQDWARLFKTSHSALLKMIKIKGHDKTFEFYFKKIAS